MGQRRYGLVCAAESTCARSFCSRALTLARPGCRALDHLDDTLGGASIRAARAVQEPASNPLGGDAYRPDRILGSAQFRRFDDPDAALSPAYLRPRMDQTDRVTHDPDDLL